MLRHLKNKDIKHPKLIYFKAFLFLLILILSTTLILVELNSLKMSLLLLLVIWSSARLYYFMFYVIENYVDPDYKFTGVGAFINYLISKKKEKRNLIKIRKNIEN